jgi:hypothetical protein
MRVEPADEVIEHRIAFGLVIDFVEQAGIDFEALVGRRDIGKQIARPRGRGEPVGFAMLDQDRQAIFGASACATAIASMNSLPSRAPILPS